MLKLVCVNIPISWKRSYDVYTIWDNVLYILLHNVLFFVIYIADTKVFFTFVDFFSLCFCSYELQECVFLHWSKVITGYLYVVSLNDTAFCRDPSILVYMLSSEEAFCNTNDLAPSVKQSLFQYGTFSILKISDNFN